MKHVEQTVTVDRPIDEVFAYLADGRNNPDWRVGVLEIERTPLTARARSIGRY
jgi:uncharacterized membrane protein